MLRWPSVTSWRLQSASLLVQSKGVKECVGGWGRGVLWGVGGGVVHTGWQFATVRVCLNSFRLTMIERPCPAELAASHLPYSMFRLCIAVNVSHKLIALKQVLAALTDAHRRSPNFLLTHIICCC